MAAPTMSAEEDYREQIRVMSEAMPAAVSITDPQGAVLWVNAFWSRFTGLPFDSALGEGWRASLQPDDLPAVDSAFRRAQAERTGFQADARLRTAEGDWRWTQIRAEPLVNRRRRIEGWITVSTDIHQQKLAAEALELGRARYEALARSTATVVFELDAAGEHKAPNPAWSAFSGLSFEARKTRGWRNILHPEDSDLALVEWESAMAEGRPAISDVRHWHAPSADYRWVRVHIVPIIGADGAIREWIGTLTDIHDRMRADAVLRESEERFRLVAENAPVNLWMGDAEGRCVYLNRQQRDFWGVPEDLAGFSWAATLLEEDRDGLFAVFAEAMAAETAFEVEARYWRADGEVRTLRTRANPRYDAAGAFLGMIGVNVDVTEARRAELHQRLLTNELNHRVKNTLATVQSLAYQTLRAYQDVGQARAVLDGRLMALSAAHNVLNRENWEAADLADVVSEALRAYDSPGQARVHFEGPAARVAPQAALAVAMVLHELATNAVKYGGLSRDGGRVALTWDLRAAAPGTVGLTWEETGGPPVSHPERQGFGSRLLANVSADLGAPAEILYLETGLTCRFSAPLGGAARAEG
ncbi:MAG: signal transduction histidine kinase [Caulobacter sp.]|nr:signal transduction histidine kinase [Caulobacter sp.]